MKENLRLHIMEKKHNQTTPPPLHPPSINPPPPPPKQHTLQQHGKQGWEIDEDGTTEIGSELGENVTPIKPSLFQIVNFGRFQICWSILF